MSALPLLVRSREDVWGTTSESPSSALEIPLLCEHAGSHAPTSAPEFEPERPSRDLPLSTFTTVPPGKTIDYWEFHRVLNSIEARLQELKREARIA